MSYKVVQTSLKDINFSSIFSINNSTYLFDCPDGTQRNLAEQGVKFSKISNLLFTKADTTSTAGYYGFNMSRWQQVSGILPAHSAKVPKSNTKQTKEETPPPENVKIYGLKSLKSMFDYSEHFFIQDQLNSFFEVNKCNEFTNYVTGESKLFQDSNITVIPFESASLCVSYFIVPNEKRRPLNSQKAKALGVKEGKDLGKLSAGQNVIINGVEIKANDVLEEAPPRNCVLILRIDTLDDVNFYLTSPEFQLKVLERNDMKYYVSVTHILLSDCSIMLVKEFLSLINLLKIVSKKIVIDNKQLNKPFLLNECKFKTTKLINSIINNNCNVSSLPSFNNSLDLIDWQLPFLKFLQEYEILLICPGWELNILKNEVCTQKFEFTKLQELDDFIKLNSIQLSLTPTIEPEIQEPTICILGSSSQKPCSHRNVSSILLEYRSKFILMDCGEGTYQQLFHLYNSAYQIDFVLCNTHIIFLTHKHGDHFLGIINFLMHVHQARYASQLTLMPLYIITPVTLKLWLENQIKLNFGEFKDFIVIDCEEINPLPYKVYKEIIDKIEATEDNDDLKMNIQDIEPVSLDKINEIVDLSLNQFENNKEETLISQFRKFCKSALNFSIFAIEVLHCNDSFGCMLLENDKKWKITYSGDTRPCNNLVNFSQGSTVVIHEATFDNSLQLDAKRKMHSTFQEALNVGKLSWRTVLTHFSPRYSKGAPTSTEIEESKTIIVHDGLFFKLSQLEDLYKYNSVFDGLLMKLEKTNILD